MGGKESKAETESSVTSDEFSELKRNTSFSHKEIREWHDKFLLDYPSGFITKEEFINMYQNMFPDGDPRRFAEYIFHAYDIDGNGEISFKEFMTTLSVSSRGSRDEKLAWAFRMYDSDHDGHVSRAEAEDVLTAIYRMKGYANPHKKAEDTAQKLFIHLDKNKDDHLSEVEFVLGAKNSPSIMEMLGDQ